MDNGNGTVSTESMESRLEELGFLMETIGHLGIRSTGTRTERPLLKPLLQQLDYMEVSPLLPLCNKLSSDSLEEDQPCSSSSLSEYSSPSFTVSPNPDSSTRPREISEEDRSSILWCLLQRPLSPDPPKTLTDLSQSSPACTVIEQQTFTDMDNQTAPPPASPPPPPQPLRRYIEVQEGIEVEVTEPKEGTKGAEGAKGEEAEVGKRKPYYTPRPTRATITTTPLSRRPVKPMAGETKGPCVQPVANPYTVTFPPPVIATYNAAPVPPAVTMYPAPQTVHANTNVNVHVNMANLVPNPYPLQFTQTEEEGFAGQPYSMQSMHQPQHFVSHPPYIPQTVYPVSVPMQAPVQVPMQVAVPPQPPQSQPQRQRQRRSPTASSTSSSSSMSSTSPSSSSSSSPTKNGLDFHSRGYTDLTHYYRTRGMIPQEVKKTSPPPPANPSPPRPQPPPPQRRVQDYMVPQYEREASGYMVFPSVQYHNPRNPHNPHNARYEDGIRMRNAMVEWNAAYGFDSVLGDAYGEPMRLQMLPPHPPQYYQQQQNNFATPPGQMQPQPMVNNRKRCSTDEMEQPQRPPPPAMVPLEHREPFQEMDTRAFMREGSITPVDIPRFNLNPVPSTSYQHMLPPAIPPLEQLSPQESFPDIFDSSPPEVDAVRPCDLDYPLLMTPGPEFFERRSP